MPRMPISDWGDHDATGLADLVRSGQVAPSELVATARAAQVEAARPWIVRRPSVCA